MVRRAMLFSLILLGAAWAGPSPAVEGAKDSCSTCHAQAPTEKARKPVELVLGKKDVHASANLSCVDCHGGVSTANTTDAAHAGIAVRPKTEKAVVAMCGKCHAGPALHYLNGPHQFAADASRQATCVTCHGAHGIAKASLELINDESCSKCHSTAPGRRIQKALFTAEREVGSVEQQLSLANGSDEAKAARARLQQARSKLRGLSHSLDLMVITRNAADALKVVDDVRAKTLPHIKARDWGKILQIGAAVAAGLMLAVGVVTALIFVWSRRKQLPIVGRIGPQHFKALAIMGGVLAVVGLAVGWRGYHYMEHEPKFCLSCHNMTSAYDLWGQSGHKNIECHACHIPDTIGNMKQLYVQLTQNPDKVENHAFIDRNVCEKCHASGTGPSKYNRVVETNGHKVHAGKARLQCVQCHSDSVHRFKPPKEICATCHQQITLRAAGTMAEMHCMQCHSFLAGMPEPKKPEPPKPAVAEKGKDGKPVAAKAEPPKPEPAPDYSKASFRPDRIACLDCHAQRQVKGEVFPTAKAPMKWDCGKCHKPHADRINLVNADCVKCHNTITEGLHKVSAHANDCMSCHKPHSWSSGTATCASCHTRIDPVRHHPEKKSCTECHGAWDDNWVKLAKDGSAAAPVKKAAQ